MHRKIKNISTTAICDVQSDYGAKDDTAALTSYLYTIWDDCFTALEERIIKWLPEVGSNI